MDKVDKVHKEQVDKLEDNMDHRVECTEDNRNSLVEDISSHRMQHGTVDNMVDRVEGTRVCNPPRRRIASRRAGRFVR